MLPINLVTNSAPRCTLELGCQPAPPVSRKIKLPAGCLPAGFEAALQTFFDEGTQRGALLLGYTPSLLRQLVRKLYGSFHTGDPFLIYGSTVLPVLSRRKPISPARP